LQWLQQRQQEEEPAPYVSPSLAALRKEQAERDARKGIPPAPAPGYQGSTHGGEQSQAEAVETAEAPPPQLEPATPPKPKLVKVTNLTTSQLKALLRAHDLEAEARAEWEGNGREGLILLLRSHGVHEVQEDEAKASPEQTASQAQGAARRRRAR